MNSSSGSRNHPLGSFHLLGFSDASEKAFAAVIYLAATHPNCPMSVSLITSKTRVAPHKQQSLPRLELCGALLLAELMNSVSQALKIQIKSKHYWSDSTITLSWIKGHPSKWKTYVANRVSKIQQLTDSNYWKFIPGTKNPADCASRGVSVPELISHPLWWAGPECISSNSNLLDEASSVDTTCVMDDPEIQKETRQPKNLCHLATSTWADEVVQRFSSLTKLNRVTSYIYRFFYALKRKTQPNLPKTDGPLTVMELKTAFNKWIQLAQAQSYEPEIKSIKTKQNLHHKSSILSLNPYLDADGLLRVGGRLKFSNLPEDAKNPILLPRKSHLTYLVLHQSHLSNLHAGIQQMMSSIRQKFWIVRAKDEIRSYIKNCVLCTKLKAETMKHLMGNLPSYRVNPARPFLNCGVDYCGPFLIRPIQPRSRVLLKAYVAVFVCFSVRAIHLEVVSNMTTSAFLAAFRRFTSRRGLPKEVRSDCGTNFVGASRELKELYKLTQSKEFQSQVTEQSSSSGIQWFFNPPASPHFGGLWEAGVKSMKFHLRRIMGNQKLTFEELTTMVTQIEAILNSRPLCLESSDPADLSALTPAHFLIGSPMNCPPDPDLSNSRINLFSRWQFVQKSTQDFWNRWSREYLTRLQHRPKWMVNRDNIKIGDMVIIKEENIPPLQWRLGRKSSNYTQEQILLLEL